MNELAKLGRRRTILVGISILIISFSTIYSYQSAQAEIDFKKLIQQIIRFSLTLVLLLFVLKGSKAARIITLILMSLGVVMALYQVAMSEAPWMAKTPLLVMVIVYGIAIYHFGMSESFKAYYNHQNQK